MHISTITTYASTIPPFVIVLIIAGGYLFFAAGHWSWPMLLDALLLAIYYARPATWPAMLLIGVIRHTPAFAKEFANLVNLQVYDADSWTFIAGVFMLPALKHYAIPAAPISLPALPIMSPSPIYIADADVPMTLAEGLKVLNTDPTAPHVGIIGATRLGKTTFVGVMLAYRESKLVIATPKSAVDDPWFGADVARPAAGTMDLDYSPIEQAIANVHQEMLRRNQPNVTDRSTITLVLDEWPELAELPGVVKKVVQLIRRGAAAGIRLIFLATDVNVRSWRMDGMAGVLDNLAFARVEDGRRWSLGRLDPNWRLLSPRALDTVQVQGLAARVSLAGRGWASATVSVPCATVGVGGIDPPNMALGTGNGERGTGNGTPIKVLAALRASGVSRDKARELGCVFRDTDWTEAGKEQP